MSGEQERITQVTFLSDSEMAILMSVKKRWTHETFHAGDHCDEYAIRDGVAWLYSLKKRNQPKVLIVDSPLAFSHKQIIKTSGIDRSLWYKMHTKACFYSIWPNMADRILSLMPPFLMRKHSGTLHKVHIMQYLDHIDNVINSKALAAQPGELFFILTMIYMRSGIIITSEESLLMMLGKIIPYDFLRETGQISSAPFDKFTQFLRAGCFLTELSSNNAIVIKRPVFTKFNNSMRLHSEDGPAIKWRDGIEIYCLNGVQVPKKVVKTPAGQLDPRLILKVRNAEVRKEVIRKIGMDNLITAFKGKLMDAWNGYELIRLSIPDMKLAPVYLKMINPSTGALHFECVAPEITTCREALSWRVGGLAWNPQQLT